MSSTGQPQSPRCAPPPLLALALVVLLALVAGCGSDDDGATGSTTTLDRTTSTARSSTTGGTSGTTSSVSSSTPTSSDGSGTTLDLADQAIVDAYVGYWDARLAANTGTPNPQDPALTQYATGNQLEAVIAETQKNLDEGRAFQAAPNPANFRRVTVVSVDGDRAEVQECFVDDTQVVERSTGRVLNDAVSTQSVLGTLRLVDGSWRVSGSELVQRWEGVAGCALAS